ncbi:hypothetical protein JW960_16490 [candidate division KSB1 bacterium]|nr:hypothetical protein [candidate division KSB1 bacterium]
MKKLIALSIADAKNISRDSTLLLILFGPFAVFGLLKFLIPFATSMLLDKLSFEFIPYYPLIVSFMILIPSMMFGLLTGFVILDERDEEIISYIAITPLRRTGYLAYKILSSFVVSFLFCFVVIYLTGLSTIPWKYAPGIAAMVALEAPITTFFLAAFAENKVEGLALSKVVGIMFFAPFIAYFVKSGWSYVAGIFPPFWITKAFFAAQAGASSYWLFLFAGVIVHVIFIFLLVKKFVDNER